MEEKFEYSLKNILEVFNLQDGFAFPSSVYTSDPTDVKLIRIQDINKKSSPKTVRIPKSYKFPNKKKCQIFKGDFLLSLSGAAGFNLMKWGGEQGYLNQRITKISIKDSLAKEFIENYEKVLIQQVYAELNSLGKGANNNLTRKDIRSINLKIPISKNGGFDLETQKQIAEKYKKIESIKSAINIELDKISETEIDL